MASLNPKWEQKSPQILQLFTTEQSIPHRPEKMAYIRNNENPKLNFYYNGKTNLTIVTFQFQISIFKIKLGV